MTEKAQIWNKFLAVLSEVYASVGVPFGDPKTNTSVAAARAILAQSDDGMADTAMAIQKMINWLATATKYRGSVPPIADFFDTAELSASDIWYALQSAASNADYSVVAVDDRPSACQWDSVPHRVLRHTGLTPTDILDDKNKPKFCAIYNMAISGILVLPAIGPKPAPKALPTPTPTQTPTTIAALYSAAVSRGYTGTDGQWTLAQLHYILRTEGPKNGAEMQKLADAWMANPVELVVLP